MKHLKNSAVVEEKTSTILAFFFVVASGQIFPQSLNGGKGKQLSGIFQKGKAVCFRPPLLHPHQYIHRSTDQKG